MLVANPIIRADMPDPDVIRVEDTYYMVSTTMFVMPGGPILKSKDLVHWELVSYIFNTIEDNDIYRLNDGKNAYGKGQWATSLKYYRGRFYACFVCHDMKRTYIYYTDDIEKSGWDRYVLEDVFHDMSFLLNDGKAYLIYGNGEIHIVELKDDLSGLKEGGINRLLFSTPTANTGLRCEGCRAYQRNGFYYLLFIEWPNDGNRRRRVVCYRSKSLLGEYERKILLDDDMGYRNQGIAQGVLIDTSDGDWYSILFQDHGALGRIPHLIPASWEDEWPVIGWNGKVPETFEIPMDPFTARPLIISDTFNHAENRLELQWQWNHNPSVQGWSFVERPGYLRLRTEKPAKDILSARNTLTQRTNSPRCAFSVVLETSSLNPGDYAGLAALQGNYGTIGVKADGNGGRTVIVCGRDADGQQCVKDAVPASQMKVHLKILFDYENDRDTASFFFSEDGIHWSASQWELQMKYTLDLFIGYRVGVFCYSENETGGYADFRQFQYTSE
ncbi:MAG: glycoside hydrolase 43 family protein [Thermoclostridium sp.]|nr:glycoside hydrolase 43 family protein [Thermoclostridium sp.]